MRILRIFGVLVLLALVAAGYLAFRLNRPYMGFSSAIFLEFPRGTSTSEMAARLAQAGVVRSRVDFLFARLGRQGRPTAGATAVAGGQIGQGVAALRTGESGHAVRPTFRGSPRSPRASGRTEPRPAGLRAREPARQKLHPF